MLIVPSLQGRLLWSPSFFSARFQTRRRLEIIKVFIHLDLIAGVEGDAFGFEQLLHPGRRAEMNFSRQGAEPVDDAVTRHVGIHCQMQRVADHPA